MIFSNETVAAAGDDGRVAVQQRGGGVAGRHPIASRGVLAEDASGAGRRRCATSRKCAVTLNRPLDVVACCSPALRNETRTLVKDAPHEKGTRKVAAQLVDQFLPRLCLTRPVLKCDADSTALQLFAPFQSSFVPRHLGLLRCCKRWQLEFYQ